MRLLTALLIALAGLPVNAGEPVEEATVTWYDVELIVFRNLDTRTSETWPPDAGVPAVEEARPLFPPPVIGDTVEGGDARADVETRAFNEEALGAAPTPYVPLDESAYQLNGVLASLKRSSRYEPVLHVAWTQPPLEREQSPYLRVTVPDALTPKETADQAIDEPLLDRENESAPAVDVPKFLAEDEGKPVLARPLDGIVKLSVGRYLHLDVDLVYLPDDLNLTVLDKDTEAATRAWTEEEKLERERRRRALLDALARGDITLEEAEILALEPEENVFQGFRLNQYRRVRSRELQYFDHPAYGAIVMVTPREVSARMLETPSQSR